MEDRFDEEFELSKSSHIIASVFADLVSVVIKLAEGCYIFFYE